MLRILPLGGIGNVTNNMYVYEYDNGHQVERLIVDCGIGFPDEEMLGADLLVPDVSYLQGKEDSIVGLVLTHGHDDHIAALPYILPLLDGKFQIYASALTAGFAQANLEDFGLKDKIHAFPHHPLQLGSFTVDPVNVTHSVPDTRHLVIQTPEGIYYHGSDFKLDWTPVDGIRPDLQKMAQYAEKGIAGLLIDCLRVEQEGYSLSETTVGDSLSREIRNIKGKVIVTTMSSNIHRIQQAIDAAVEHGRKVSFIGRSVEENVEIAQRLGFLHIPDKAVINKRKIAKYPDQHLCLIVAGSQGQVGSTLTRLSKNEHAIVSVKPGDHVIFSADPIPGNERNVYRTIDDLARLGATISYREIQDDLHVSGHASAQELRMMLTLLKPKHIVPIGGTYRHMNQFQVLATEMGWLQEDVILLKSGEMVAFSHKDAWIDNRIKLKTVIVDGLGVGDVGPQVLSDRRKMSQSGMVVIAIPMEVPSNIVNGAPQVITRGFVFAKRSKELLDQIAEEVLKLLPVGSLVTDWQERRTELQEQIEKFIFIETQREPLVEVVLVKS